MASSLPLLPAPVFGILGNIISFCVFLAPVKTFYGIHRRKSTEGFQSIPYSVALFSCMLLLFYGYLKTENGIMIMTINSIGCIIESAYLTVFILYATQESLISTVNLLVIFNVMSYGLIVTMVLLTTTEGSQRVTVVGWICAVFSVAVFAAPLSVMRTVIKTKSVEYMPFMLSFFLTLCAIMWFFYGLLIEDYYVATPNVLGFMFGVAQMILYMIYRGQRRQVRPLDQPVVELATAVVNLEVILAVVENPTVEREVVGEMEENPGEIGVGLELQENPMVQAEDGGEDSGEKKEGATKVGADLEGEMTSIPSIV